MKEQRQTRDDLAKLVWACGFLGNDIGNLRQKAIITARDVEALRAKAINIANTLDLIKCQIGDKS